MDLGDFLRRHGLERYATPFTDNDVDLATLPELSEDDLRELGLPLGARRRLQKALREWDAGNDGDATAATTPSATAERRQITVLFCDLVGSTALSEALDPEELRDLMTAYQQAAAGVIARHEGHVAQYLGDGLMVYFGWPRAHEDAAALAVRSALELTTAVKQVVAPTPLAVRIGIATGAVVVGETGDGDASVPQAAVGETPNVAARLQALAGPDQVVLSDATRRLAGGAFVYHDLGQHELKGISRPVTAWALVGDGGGTDRFDASRQGRLTPLAGRESELAMLRERWDQAGEGDGQLVLLSGDPGIGKSRLSRALRDALREERITTLRYQCSPHHTHSAFYPIVAQIEHAAGFLHDDSAATRMEKLNALLTASVEAPRRAAALLAVLLDLPGARDQSPQLTPAQLKERLFELVTSQVLYLATAQPLLMIFEDAHWADPTTLEVLGRIIERIGDARVLLLVTHRPEFEAPWQRVSHATVLSLNRLGRRQAHSVARNIAGAVNLDDALLQNIVARADGIPLFVEELTRAVLESGNADDHDIPATLKDSLAARLDRLGAARQVAQVGACIGRQFGRADLQRALTATDVAITDLDGMLAQLVAADMVSAHGHGAAERYTFRHALVQEAAYQSLLRSRRQVIHAAVAATLDSRDAGGSDVEPQVIAQHYAAAAMPERAIVLWQQAGNRATRQSASVEAAEHFRQALALVPELSPGLSRDRLELTLRIAHASALAVTTGFASQETMAAYEAARDLCDRVGDAEQRFPTLYGLILVYLVRADIAAAADASSELLEAAADADDDGLVLEANVAAAIATMYHGHLAEARAHCDTGVQLYDPARHGDHVVTYRQDPGMTCLSFRARALWMLGYPDQALADSNRAIELARASDHPFSLAYALLFAGFVHQWRGESERALACSDGAIELCEDHGFTFYLGWSLMLRGWTRATIDPAATGVDEIERGYAIYHATGASLGRPLLLGWLAEARLRRGETEAGLANVAEALADVAATAERWNEPELWRLRGELLRARDEDGDEDAAAAAFDAAIRVAGEIGARSWELRARTSVVRLRRVHITLGAQLAAMAVCRQHFREGRDTADLRATDALLKMH